MTAPCRISAQVDAIHAIASGLSDREKLEVIRALNEDLTYSWGSDRIEDGCAMVEADLADEAAPHPFPMEQFRAAPYHGNPL